MKLDVSGIEMSESDMKRGVKLPACLDSKLAELLGIMVGDGHLGYYPTYSKRGNIRFVRRDVKIACNKKEHSYIHYIMRIFYSLFNIKLKQMQDTVPNCIILRAHSKGIVQFLNEVGGIPLNNKTSIVTVPPIINEAPRYVIHAFLRGLADTDFSVSFKNKTRRGHTYPVIKGSFKSKHLIKDLECLFSKLGFKHCTCYNLTVYDKRYAVRTTIHSIYLNGIANFEKWVTEIGFSNQKFKRKVQKWKTDGVCPPGY